MRSRPKMIKMTALAAESMMPATIRPTATSVLSPRLAAALPLMSAVMTCHIKAPTDGSVPTPDRMHRTAYTLMMRGIFLTSVALGTLGSSSFRSIHNLSRFAVGTRIRRRPAKRQDKRPNCSNVSPSGGRDASRRKHAGSSAPRRLPNKMFGCKTDYKLGGLLKSAVHARECLSCRAYNRAGNAK